MISIFVAKLDFGVDNAQLTALFEEYGRVIKATVALDRETRKSRGFGFVEMADDEEGQAAIAALDGSMVNGRPIAVKEAEDRGGSKRPERKPGGYEPRERRDDSPSERPAPRSTGTPRPPIAPSISSDDDSPSKMAERKKDREPKKKEKPKTHKMEAYKKSGKNRIIFDDDDDEDIPPLFDFSDEEE